MALPTQEIERLTRGSTAEQGTYKQLLLLSGTLLAISLILYGGLSFGYEPYLEGQVSSLDAKIQDFSRQIPIEDQAKLTSFYSQLANLKTLIGKHASNSKVFDWLEGNTQGNVYFTKLTFNASTYQLTLIGNSRTPDDAAEQAAIIEDQPEVLRLNFNNLAPAATGGWQFNISIFLDPKAFMDNGGIKSQPAPAIQNQAAAPTATTTTSTRQ